MVLRHRTQILYIADISERGIVRVGMAGGGTLALNAINTQCFVPAPSNFLPPTPSQLSTTTGLICMNLELRPGQVWEGRRGGEGWANAKLWYKHCKFIPHMPLHAGSCEYVLYFRTAQVVLESGTGSASLTHSLARAVAPGGHVHTYEFHLERAGEGGGVMREGGHRTREGECTIPPGMDAPGARK